MSRWWRRTAEDGAEQLPLARLPADAGGSQSGQRARRSVRFNVDNADSDSDEGARPSTTSLVAMAVDESGAGSTEAPRRELTVRERQSLAAMALAAAGFDSERAARGKRGHSSGAASDAGSVASSASTAGGCGRKRRPSNQVR